MSDKDLGAIVSWAEQRFRLHPTSCDWGVVCGLTVGVDPKNPSNVTVGPGYGFDRNRDLCVVHAALNEPLCAAKCAGCGVTSGDTVTMPGPGPVEERQFRGLDLRVYDVRLSTRDCPQHKSLALSLDGKRHCEDTRLKTWAKVTIVPVMNVDVPIDPALEFLKRLGEEKVLSIAIDASNPLPGDFATRMNQWLASELKRYPALELPWPRLPQNWETPAQARVHLSWIVFGLRRLRACPVAARDPSIPLARIWTLCKGGLQDVVWIDNSAPHRRVLDCGPCGFKLRDWIGERLEDAKRAAAAWQITLTATEAVVQPTSLAELTSQIEKEIELGQSIRPLATVTAYYYLAPTYKLDNGQPEIKADDKRIFAFTETPATGAPLTT